MFTTHVSPEYLTSDVFSPEVRHCFTTRRGGVSAGCLSSLNLGIHRGDDWNNVYENYRRLGQAVGFTPEQTVFTHQTHTDIVARVGAEDRGWGLFREVEPERDGIYTDEPGVALVCFAADCTPILLHDPVRHAVAAVHAGWRGTALGIVRRCVEAMHRDFGSEPGELEAAIGPCIGPCCFETDANVPQAIVAGLGAEAEPLIRTAGEKFFPDLKKLNALWLRQCGVRKIDLSCDCTRCQPDRFWSHRVTGNARGSQAAVILLREREETR